MVRPSDVQNVGDMDIPGRSRALFTRLKLRAGFRPAVLRLFFNEISQSLARRLGLSYQPKR
jgi:hypothetical protein